MLSRDFKVNTVCFFFCTISTFFREKDRQNKVHEVYNWVFTKVTCFEITILVQEHLLKAFRTTFGFMHTDLHTDYAYFMHTEYLYCISH